MLQTRDLGALHQKCIHISTIQIIEIKSYHTKGDCKTVFPSKNIVLAGSESSPFICPFSVYLSPSPQSLPVILL